MMARLRKALGFFTGFLLAASLAYATTITWSHTFSDGEVLTANMLETMKTDISSVVNAGGGPVGLTNTQTVSGDKTFSGTLTVSGTLSATGSTLTLGNAATDSLTIGAAIQGASPIILDGATDNTNVMTVTVADFSTTRTLTVPDQDVNLTDIGNAGDLIQVGYASTAAMTTGTTTVPHDDTVPTSSEGDAISGLSVALTAKSATDVLDITVSINYSNNTGSLYTAISVFKDTTNIGTYSQFRQTATQYPETVTYNFRHTPGDTSAHTYTVRIGADSGTTTINGENGARLYGGALASTITVREVRA